MYLMRGTRPDIAFITCKLARFVSKWCKVHDVMLHRVMQYLQHTLHHALHLRVCSSDRKTSENHIWIDADHAGDIFDAKSTGGFIQSIVGPNGTFATFDWDSRKQRATAHSSGEAEIVALGDLIKPALVTWNLT